MKPPKVVKDYPVQTWGKLNKKFLKGKLQEYKDWTEGLDSIPNQIPLVITSARPKDYSGVYSYRPSILDYEELCERFFKDRNKTYKKNFIHYLSQLYSTLIESELLPDGTLTEKDMQVLLYSKNLKTMNRNYSDFNKVLLSAKILELISLHNKAKKKCRGFRIPREIVKKGIQHRYLSQIEKDNLVKTIRVNDGPDKTPSKPTPVQQYYLEVLRQTKILQTDFDDLEINVGRFRKLYPNWYRYQQGKYDLIIGPNEERLYSVYLYSPKEFRKLIRYDGQHQMVEGDVGGCHFHFLLSEMTDPKERKEMEKDLLRSDPYLSMCGHPNGITREDLKDSSHIFKYGNRVVNPYSLYSDKNLNRVPYTEGLFYLHLSKKYPIFCQMMSEKKISHKKHRSDYSYVIMRRESKVMVQMVGERCMAEKLAYLPIHDGFLTLPSQYDRVCHIVTECFKLETGSVPKIKRK